MHHPWRRPAAFPGDGSNGVNVLTEGGIAQRHHTSLGTALGCRRRSATIRLKVLDTKNGSAALKGAAVYLWHCNIDGKYSLYSDGVTQENYLRGVQETDGDGAGPSRASIPLPLRSLAAHPLRGLLDAATKAIDKLAPPNCPAGKGMQARLRDRRIQRSVSNLARTSSPRTWCSATDTPLRPSVVTSRTG